MSDSLSLGQDQQTITFNEIPAGIRDPGMRIEVRPNYGNIGLLLLPSKAIVISQMLASGKAVPGQVYPITAAGQAEYLFGAGSVAATQINAWRLNNTTTPLFAVGLVDVAGAVAATALLETTSAAFPNGFACTVVVGGMQIPVVTPAGTENTDLATAIVAAVNAMAAAPVTAAIEAGNGNAGNVLFTAKNTGVVGNSLNVRINNRSDASAPLVGLTLVAPAVEPTSGGTWTFLSGGLGSPVVEPVLTTIAGDWYTDIVTPWTDATNRGELAAEGVRRYGAMVNLDARIWGGLGGSYATVVGYGDAGNSIQMPPSVCATLMSPTGCGRRCGARSTPSGWGTIPRASPRGLRPWG